MTISSQYTITRSKPNLKLEPWKRTKFSRKWMCPYCAAIMPMGVKVKQHREVCKGDKGK